MGVVRMTWPFHGLTPGKYSLISADPPWRFVTRSDKGHGKSPESHYPCMSLDAIKALPVAALAAPDCALIMWGTFPLLPAALDTLDAWGFRYCTGGAWAKQSSTGRKLAFGTGYVYRSAAEFWLVGKRGNPKARSRSIRNLILAPVREHSRKPDQMHTDLESLFDGPRCELFARQARPGWDIWGNQTSKFTAPGTLPGDIQGLTHSGVHVDEMRGAA
jgi:N6-adenosine-specific RNA methylase IME4